MTRIAYATLTLCLLAGAAAAQVCHAPIVAHAPVVHQAAAVKVVKEVVVPVAVPVLIPAYGAVYTPPVVPASPAPAAQAGVPPADLRAIADSLRAIDQRLRSLEGGKPAAPPAPPPAPAEQPRPADPFNPTAPQAQTAPPAGNALAIVTAKCAQCHSGDGAKGGGLVLVENGTLAKIPDRAGRKTLSTVYRGTMPPKSSGIAPLTDEEVSVLVAHYGQ